MITRQDIVDEALSWVGTPHDWQSSQKGRGCDCKGLISGVARELGLECAKSFYAEKSDYEKVDPRLLRHGIAELFDRGEKPELGDVVILKMNKIPQHLGIIGDGVLIHTYGRGPEQVTAGNLKAALRLWPLDSVWCWRDVSWG